MTSVSILPGYYSPGPHSVRVANGQESLDIPCSSQEEAVDGFKYILLRTAIENGSQWLWDLVQEGEA